MIAMRYGTIPIIRETGGLRDTVEPYNQYPVPATVFRFATSTPMSCCFSPVMPATSSATCRNPGKPLSGLP
jgi:hypothetical protein